MAIAADDPIRPDGIQRGRGGFLRNAADVPYVTDPSGATVKSGPRRGEPKRLAYGSPSNRGKQIENTTNLVKWGERRVVLGIGADPALVEMCARLTALDVDSDEYKTLADAIIIRAKDAAEANLAAERGTHGHSLTEDADGERDWLARAAVGEVLGLDRDVQAALVAAWAEMLERSGMEILVVEASCVDDSWRLAGTLDRIARVTRPLRFALVTGEVVEIPAGTVLVLDVKTGQRRRDRDGSVMYWHGYAIQIASYAQSVPYDTDAETRGEWPWPISQERALIAHLDIAAALEGEPRCELVYVDLVAGREHGGECVVAAKAWERRKDVFSVAMLDAPSDASPAREGDARTVLHAAVATSPAALSPEVPIPAASPSSGDDSPPESALARPAPGRQSWLREAQVARAEAFEQRRRLTRTPDEGDPLGQGGDSTWNVLESRYRRLPATAIGWLRTLTEQAAQAGVSFQARDGRTARRYEIIRTLVLLAESEAGGPDEEAMRCLLATVIGDAAHFDGVNVGQLVGSLDVHEAARFAGACDAFTGGRMTATVDETGTVSLHSAA